MPTTAYQQRNSLKITAIAVFAALCAILMFAWVPNAQAHDQLIGSNPEQGENLAEAPEVMQLTYSAIILEMGYAVQIIDAQGIEYGAELALDGPDVNITLTDPLPQDEWFEIRWRVVSSDGHPISGIINFSVGDVGEQPEFPAEAVGAAGDEEDVPADLSEVSPEVDDSAAEQAAETTDNAAEEAEVISVEVDENEAGTVADENSGGLSTLAYALIGAGIGLVIFLVLYARNRKGKATQHEGVQEEQ